MSSTTRAEIRRCFKALETSAALCNMADSYADAEGHPEICELEDIKRGQKVVADVHPSVRRWLSMAYMTEHELPMNGKITRHFRLMRAARANVQREMAVLEMVGRLDAETVEAYTGFAICKGGVLVGTPVE